MDPLCGGSTDDGLKQSPSVQATVVGPNVTGRRKRKIRCTPNEELSPVAGVISYRALNAKFERIRRNTDAKFGQVKIQLSQQSEHVDRLIGALDNMVKRFEPVTCVGLPGTSPVLKEEIVGCVEKSVCKLKKEIVDAVKTELLATLKGNVPPQALTRTENLPEVSKSLEIIEVSKSLEIIEVKRVKKTADEFPYPLLDARGHLNDVYDISLHREGEGSTNGGHGHMPLTGNKTNPLAKERAQKRGADEGPSHCPKLVRLMIPPRVTPIEQTLIAYIFSENEASSSFIDCAIAESHHRVLYKSAMGCLKPMTWVEADVINIAADFLQMSATQMWFFPTYFSQSALSFYSSAKVQDGLAEKIESVCNLRGRFDGPVSECIRMFIPIHDTFSQHWYLLVVYPMRCTVEIWDSMEVTSRRSSREVYARSVLVALDEVFTTPSYCWSNSNLKFANFSLSRPGRVPQQSNTWDCGIFVIRNMQTLCSNWHDADTFCSDSARIGLLFALAKNQNNLVDYSELLRYVQGFNPKTPPMETKLARKAKRQRTKDCISSGVEVQSKISNRRKVQDPISPKCTRRKLIVN